MLTNQISAPMAADTIFTVFTPTYNRASTLLRVYESLVSQTFKSFEWLIVDDGSHDNTRELVRQWQSEGKVRIRYFFQHNAGKHIAHNRAVDEAHGQLLIVLDSDDACVPHALECLHANWLRIPPSERDGYSGVSCLCMDPSGRLVGSAFPDNLMSASPLLLASRYKVRGEKWGFHRTDVLREFRFPEFDGERFIPEGLVWNRIAGTYKLLLVNERLRIYHPNPAGLDAGALRLRARNPRGACLYYEEHARLAPTLLSRVCADLNFMRFALHARARGIAIRPELGPPRLSSLLWPAAWSAFLIDRYRLRR